MLTKSVIVALSLLAMVNRSLSLSCRRCSEVDCGPSPTCNYGVTKGICHCCDVCAKGPGETCGGMWGRAGTCSEGFKCTETYRIGICVRRLQSELTSATPDVTITPTEDTFTTPDATITTLDTTSSTRDAINTTSDVCNDISPNCALNVFQCDTNTYVQERCRKTCGLCGGNLGCGGEFNSNIGTIRYPMNGGYYNNNEDCTWIIRATNPIEITFSTFNTETCCDALFIRDGETSKSAVLGIFSGDSIPSIVEISTNVAYLHFTSDYRINNTGFVLHWESLSISGTTCEDTWSEGLCIDGERILPDGTRTFRGGCHCSEIKSTGQCDDSEYGHVTCRKTCGHC